MSAFQGFPPLLAIFYSEFHPTQGPKVTFEVPEGFVTSTSLSNNAAHGGASSSLNLASVATSAAGTPGLGVGGVSSLPGASAFSAVPLSPPSFAFSHHPNNPPTVPPASLPPPISQYNTIHRPTDTNIHDSYLDFDAISEYIIPKPELCNRLVTISTPLYKVMGYPVSIQDAKYERNALLFNLCFVFEQGRETGSYEQVVRKMARVLRSLEVESEFLYNPSTKSALLNIMEQLLEDLNSYSECQIPINDANMINIKLFPKYRDPPPVYDYQVPVLIVNLEKVMDKYWDLTMQRILPHIDGVHSVKKIAEIGDVDPTLVRIAIQHLLYYGVVKMVDIFQFSNVYAIKPSISYLLRSQRLQSECVNFVSRPGVPRPAFALLYSLYCALKHGLPVRDWVDENHIWALNIDPRRFILYGVIKGFVYRVHKFPVWITHPGDILSDSPNRSLKRFLNGRKHFDELCTLFGCNSKELDETLKADPNIRIIWK